MQAQASSCKLLKTQTNFLQAHASSGKLMQAQASSCKLLKTQANFLHAHGSSSKLMQAHASSCMQAPASSGQFLASSCKLMQAHACKLTQVHANFLQADASSCIMAHYLLWPSPCNFLMATWLSAYYQFIADFSFNT